MLSRSDASLLHLPARRALYAIVSKFPGLHLREIQRKADLATGELEYHLGILERAGLVKSRRIEGYLRFFPRGLGEFEARALSILRQENSRRIVLRLMLSPDSNQRELASLVGLSPATISWYMSRLEAWRIIGAERRGREIRYSVRAPSQIAKLLASFRKSFKDKLVDNFLDMWEGT